MWGLESRMFVGTWNVGGKSPYEELKLGDWLGTAAPADIYVLGYFIVTLISSLQISSLF